MSLIQVTTTIKHEPERWKDGTAAEECTHRAQQLRDAGKEVTRNGNSLGYTITRSTYTETVQLRFIDEEVPGQTDAFDMLEEK